MKARITVIHLQAMRYVVNTGGAPDISRFDDDHDPIGPNLRDDLLNAGLIEIKSVITLTAAGKERLK